VVQVSRGRNSASRLALAALAMACAMPAAAFTLGRLEVRSHLGQPFDATLSFASRPDEEVDASCFSLLPRNPGDGVAGLPAATIEVIRAKDGGQAQIRTRQPVREPIVGLALRAGCVGKGEFRRDFTLTLDPPPQTAR